MWGEPCNSTSYNVLRVISTHSPRVGRTLLQQHKLHIVADFNSLAPCGANLRRRSLRPLPRSFQLTRPVWGEPYNEDEIRAIGQISTHSPRVGRTAHSSSSARLLRNFNSLAPCGANLALRRTFCRREEFQLTRPVWGEPRQVVEHRNTVGHFNSLAPCGANQVTLDDRPIVGDFNSLAPCGANRNNG